jgi:hypothetical protein
MRKAWESQRRINPISWGSADASSSSCNASAVDGQVVRHHRFMVLVMEATRYTWQRSDESVKSASRRASCRARRPTDVRSGRASEQIWIGSEPRARARRRAARPS